MSIINKFFTVVLFSISLIGVFVLIFNYIFQLSKLIQKSYYNFGNGKSIIAFYHPYCNSGGGGERVLWMIIYALLSSDQFVDTNSIVIYSGDISTNDGSEIFASVSVIRLLLNFNNTILTK